MQRNGLYPVIFFLLLFLTSCNSCNKKKIKQPTPVAKELKGINFFLETSASMAGYFQGNSDLVRMIPNLLVDIEGKISFKNKSVKIYYLSDSLTSYNKGTREFIHDISTTRVAAGKSSLMHRVFETVANATDSNDISILVSDCILSYADGDIKNNPEINVQKADGELKAFVKRVFMQMQQRNVAATVYGFSSAFTGTYYTYQNGKIKLNNAIRPYYVWVIGNKELLQRFNKELSGISGFAPEFNNSFGMFDKPIGNYTLLFKTGKEGDWIFDDNHLKKVAASGRKPVQFSIAVDLSSLPAYARDVKYLEANIKVDKSDLEGKIISIKPARDFNISKAPPRERSTIQNASHIITLEVSDIYQSTGSINLKMPLQSDTAYRNWSVMNDKDIVHAGKKTFAFEHLVDGVSDAYQNNNNYYINIIIHLKK